MTTTRLPQVDKILRHEKLVECQFAVRRELLAELVREHLARLRAERPDDAGDLDAIACAVAKEAQALLKPSLQKIINATGVVLNTNLGRAPLNRQALSDLVDLGSGYCNLEFDMESGKRGERSASIERLLQLLTDAEAALVVNNNAAAVLLAVTALARGKKVVVSRGELIEIGGSFRLPDVVAAGGARLSEVGTTNRTRLADYRAALDEKSALLLRCHRSNFEIRGFTEGVELADLVELAKQKAVPLLEDLGSGVLFEIEGTGISREPTVKEVVATNCDLVSFSGDKLLGGPQAGFLVGKRPLIEKLRRHPLYRALRLDKLTLALLERTLIAYLSPHPDKQVPVLAMLSEKAESLKARAQKLAATVGDASTIWRMKVVDTVSTAGGGSLPGDALPSFGLFIAAEGIKPNKLVHLLRKLDPPVIATVMDEGIVLDFRSISESDQQLLEKSLLQLAKILS